MTGTASVLAVYEALLALSRRQIQALELGEAEAFERLVEEREARFDELKRRDAEVAALAPAERQAAAALISQILASDEALGRVLAETSRQNQEELSALHTGLSALNSYAQRSEGGEAMFFDRSS